MVGTPVLDSLHLLYSVWQIVFLFGWFFVIWIEKTCAMFPLLNFYMNGTAVTSIISFLLSFLQIVISDHSQGIEQCRLHCLENDKAKDDREEVEEVGMEESDGHTQQVVAARVKARDEFILILDDEAEMKSMKEQQRDEVFNKLFHVILVAHLGWLLLGSFTVFPSFLSQDFHFAHRLVTKCHSVSKVWVAALGLGLQWLLGGVFLMWQLQAVVCGRERHLVLCGRKDHYTHV